MALSELASGGFALTSKSLEGLGAEVFFAPFTCRDSRLARHSCPWRERIVCVTVTPNISRTHPNIENHLDR